MKRFVTLTAAILCGVAAFGYNQEIRSIKIGCVLDSLGTAHITETWDVSVEGGTEWYLVRNNLADIKIEDFSVADEDGRVFMDEGGWDIDRSIEAKAYRSGINKTSDGCELCWGVGSYGSHKWTVRYKMVNAAKSLADYDMLHIQFVSPGLSARPEDVRLVLQVQDEKLDTTCARIWGFGYNGSCEFQKGYVVMQSSEQFASNSSLILLLRLDKGIIKPQSKRSCDFQNILDVAMEGADFGEEGKVSPLVSFLAGFLQFLVLGGWLLIFIPLLMIEKRSKFRKTTGVKSKKEIGWCRDIPFKGDIAVGDYVLKQTGERTGKAANVASALILRMIQVGALGVRKADGDKIEITFENKDKIEGWDSYADSLWRMMVSASGSDNILQDKEFGRWAKNNTSRVSSWVKNVENRGSLNYKEYPLEEAQAEARKMLGLKKFLMEFTLIRERATQEAVLWQDYLVFGALLGVADKVAKELKDINPKVLDEASSLNSMDMYDVLYLSRSLARAITTAQVSESSKSVGSGGGFGGGASFGGGGGFSGGGFGGGSR